MTSQLPAARDFSWMMKLTLRESLKLYTYLLTILSALQLLDLPPDDEQVLAVFPNAASGWGGSDRNTADEDALGVLRKDFFAVCAILFKPGADESVDSAMRSGSFQGKRLTGVITMSL